MGTAAGVCLWWVITRFPVRDCASVARLLPFALRDARGGYPMSTSENGPVTASERIPTLDIVRGFALLGIFIMNMPGFSTSFFAEADGSRLWEDPVNKYAEIIRNMLFAGKFNSMFSLLFGIGFTIQLGRMMARDPTHGTTLY